MACGPWRRWACWVFHSDDTKRHAQVENPHECIPRLGQWLHAVGRARARLTAAPDEGRGNLRAGQRMLERQSCAACGVPKSVQLTYCEGTCVWPAARAHWCYMPVSQEPKSSLCTGALSMAWCGRGRCNVGSCRARSVMPLIESVLSKAYSCSCAAGQGVVLVDGGATAGFCAAWAAQPCWAFALDYTPLMGAHSDPELALPPAPSAFAYLESGFGVQLTCARA